MFSRIALALLFASNAAVAAPPAARIHEVCKGFEVDLSSATGDAMEDDMTVSVTFAGETVRVPLAAALFTPRHPLLNVTNLCSELTALEAGPDRVLLLLSRNSRPQWDRLDAVLLDTRTHRVLGVLSDLGEIKSGNDVLVVKAAGKGAFDVRLIREDLENSGCDCAESAIDDWMRISVIADRLSAAWRDAPAKPAAH